MKKSDLNLTNLPETFKKDNGGLVKSKYFEIGVFSWSADDEQSNDFCTDEYCLGYLSNFQAAVNHCDEPLWLKVDTDELSVILTKLEDDDDCKIIFALWPDDNRVDEFCLKPVAVNNKWTYFLKSKEPVFFS